MKDQAGQSTLRYWVSWNSRSPSRAPSRPRPLCLTPPNGADGIGDEPAVDADHAGVDRLAEAQRVAEVAGEDVRRQPVLGVVDQLEQL